MVRAVLLVLAGLGLGACLAARPPWLGDDYALVSGGTIYPEAGARPVEALLIEDARVLALGTKAEVEAFAAEIVRHAADFHVDLAPRHIELAGGTAVPGLI